MSEKKAKIFWLIKLITIPLPLFCFVLFMEIVNEPLNKAEASLKYAEYLLPLLLVYAGLLIFVLILTYRFHKGVHKLLKEMGENFDQEIFISSALKLKDKLKHTMKVSDLTGAFPCVSYLVGLEMYYAIGLTMPLVFIHFTYFRHSSLLSLQDVK